MSNEQDPPEPGPAWAQQDPYAGDPPPGGLSPMGPAGSPPGDDDDAPEPPWPGGYGAQPGGYGPAGSAGYGSSGSPGGYEAAPPQSGGYGAPPQSGQPGGGPAPSGYGAPQQSPYGGSPPGSYGNPQPDPYGAPQPGSYGAPQPGSYGAPQPGSYGAPQPGPYGNPQPGSYGNPQPGSYGAPQPGPYGSPQPGSYGAPQPGAPGYGGAPGGPPGAGPGGPGAGQGWLPPYPQQERPQRNNRPLIIGGIAGGVVLLLVVVAWFSLPGLSGGDSKGDKTNAPTAGPTNTGPGGAVQAAQGLGAVPALRFSGTFSSGGDDFQAQLSVTKAGSAVGTIKVGGNKADLVSVDGKTYLKAPKAFWRDQGGVTANPEDYAGRWSRAPESAINLDIKNVLAAAAIVQGLRGIGSDQQPSGGENINGTPAVKVTGTDADYYLSTASPPKLLRIAGLGTQTYQFDVTEVTTTEITTLFQQLRDAVRALDGARDPSVRFLPTAKIKTSNCGASSCTMKLTVTTVTTEGSARFRARMLGKISVGGPTGRTLGTCSDSVSASSGKRINLSCTVRGGAWSAWARSIRGTASYYVQARAVAEAVNAGSLLSLLDQEQQGA